MKDFGKALNELSELILIIYSKLDGLTSSDFSELRIGTHLQETFRLAQRCYLANANLNFSVANSRRLLSTLSILEKASIAINAKQKTKITMRELKKSLNSVLMYIDLITKDLTLFESSKRNVPSGAVTSHPYSLTTDHLKKQTKLTASAPAEVLMNELPAQENATVVPIHFATTRVKDINSENHRIKFQNGKGNTELKHGIATVSIPKGHQPGNIESPKWWKLEFREDLKKHIVITTCIENTLDDWDKAAKLRVQETGSNTALVYIHGFNVEFDEAIITAAQIGFDMQYKGLIMAFDWSSEGSLHGYIADGDNAELAIPGLIDFLLHLKNNLKISTINVIAHSMGNKVFLKAMEGIENSEQPLLGQVVFAAPDVDAEIFKLNFTKLHGKAKGYTLYASSNDLPIYASSVLRTGYIRAGDGGSNLLLLANLVSIDASEVGASIFGLGHSYFAELREVLADIRLLIDNATPPDERHTLNKRFRNQTPYWEIAS
jgi:esterase/lipase superfamily enzyme